MKVLTRMGDSSNVELTMDELRQEFIAGSELAAQKAKIPALTENEVDYLVDMFAAPTRIWGVQRGHEVVMTKDGCVNALNSSRMSSGVTAPAATSAVLRAPPGRLSGEACLLHVEDVRAGLHAVEREPAVLIRRRLRRHSRRRGWPCGWNDRDSRPRDRGIRTFNGHTSDDASGGFDRRLRCLNEREGKDGCAGGH